MGKKNQKDQQKLLYKVNQCISYQDLYALEDDFNAAGLTVQTTARNWMVLCRIKDGKPVIKDVIDDYIFIGSLDDAMKELTDRAAQKICDFIQNSSGKPGKVENIARVWRNGLRMYNSSIAVANEDIQRIAGEVIIEG